MACGMTTRPDSVAPPQPSVTTETADARRISATIRQLQITLLECQVAALERELRAERERRKAVVTRYEQLLDER